MGLKSIKKFTLKGLARAPLTLSGFEDMCGATDPKVVAALQPWAAISERLRRKINNTFPEGVAMV
jgi:hypothetical protein